MTGLQGSADYIATPAKRRNWKRLFGKDRRRYSKAAA
jgi:hypothetical protein